MLRVLNELASDNVLAQPSVPFVSRVLEPNFKCQIFHF